GRSLQTCGAFVGRGLFLHAKGQQDRRVRTPAEKLLDGGRVAVRDENDIEAAARENGGKLIGSLDRRGAMSLVLEHGIERNPLDRGREAVGGVGVDQDGGRAGVLRPLIPRAPPADEELVPASQ